MKTLTKFLSKLPAIFLPVYLLFATIKPNVAVAQCSEGLAQARVSYEKGQFQDAVNNVNPCIEKSIDKTYLWQAYKLQALSYIYLNEMDKAREAIIKMLELNPTYKTSLLKDPKEFIDLTNSITIIPRFSVGVSIAGGINNTIPILLNSYNVADFTKNYNARNGYQFGIFGNYNFTQNFMLETGIFSSTKNYNINYEIAGWDINVSEKLNYLEVPLSVKYSFGKRRIVPYLNAGVFAGFLTNSTNNISRTYKNTNEEFFDENLPSADRRNKTNLGLLGGAGLMIKFGQGNFLLDYRYLYGMSNITNATERYNNPDLLYGYYYIDDDVMLRSSMISIGYAYNLSYKVLKNKK